MIDSVACLVSDRIVPGLSPHLCITWARIRLRGVRMISMDQDHAFPYQYLLQLGIRSDYLTMVSKVPCARITHCAAWRDGENSSIIDPFLFKDNREVF